MDPRDVLAGLNKTSDEIYRYRRPIMGDQYRAVAKVLEYPGDLLPHRAMNIQEQKARVSARTTQFNESFPTAEPKILKLDELPPLESKVTEEPNMIPWQSNWWKWFFPVGSSLLSLGASYLLG